MRTTLSRAHGAIAWTCAVLLAGPPIAAADTTTHHVVANGANMSVSSSGPNGSFNLNAWRAATRGADGTSLTYVYFSLWRYVTQDTFEAVYGSGYVPSAALTSQPNRVRLTLEDLTSEPGVFVVASRCVQFSCEPLTPGPLPVDIVVASDGTNTEERFGVTRRQWQLPWQPGVTEFQLEHGATSTSRGVASGVLGSVTLPEEDAYMRDAWLGRSHGTTVTIQRTTP